MTVRYIDSGDILLDKKLYEKIYGNILIYYILYKTFMSSKALRIWFDRWIK